MPSATVEFHKAKEITPGFFNLRTSFTRLMGMLDIGTHMSFLKLNSGKFLVIDTVELNDQSKAEVDRITDNGKLIEAVVATHPYHTLYFPAFYKLYPDAKYYGTPRHLKVQPEIPWAGDVNEESVRKLWEPEIEMRIPEGSEFVYPLPETSNHFNNVFVFHKASRTVHVDDTILISNSPGFLLRLIGFKEGSMMFHPSMSGPGLYPNEDAPKQFICWLEKMMNDWDFDSMASAHNGYMVGGAKALVKDTLEKAKPQLAKLSKNRSQDVGSWSMNACECG
ncbi:hypothetical protein HK101_005964 [Irineochytrium annulatum]|nr:hypothetical protein HK101_005964 [Irineochytrium annulatum]